MNPSAPPSATVLLLLPRFEAFIEALCQCVAAEGARHRISGPLVVLIWTRLRRLGKRFSRLVTNPGAKNRPHRRKEQKSGKSGPGKNLPSGFAWLLRLMPGTAAIASQLRHMLEQSEMADLIATTPSAGRILRPLCHTLGIRISAPPLALPPRKRKPRPRREPQQRPPNTRSVAKPAPRTKKLPSVLTPRPDNPLWPRLPASAFFTGLKFRT